MQARAPLMIEHRRIEKMINIIKQKLSSAEQSRSIDPYFVDTAVDFIRVYADRTHHGKEEDIMFKELGGKNLSEKDQKMMDELISDHIFSRNNTKILVEANKRYREGEQAALTEIVSCLKTMVDFYPIHIKKEDDVFFPAARSYFSEKEDQSMLSEFWEFDRKLIHEKYQAVVKEYETK